MKDYMSEAYLKMAKELHDRMPEYGARGYGWLKALQALVREYDAETVLDYGCGKGTLGEAVKEDGMDIVWREYEPAIEQVKDERVPSDIVFCTHVLEHVEPHLILSVIQDLSRLTQKVCFICVSYSSDSGKTLADGRDSNLIVKSPTEWLEMLKNNFDMTDYRIIHKNKFRHGRIKEIKKLDKVNLEILLEK